MNNLNIYKVSGCQKVGYTDKVQYWLAGTNDLANTRAMNYVLSELNLANTTLSVTTNVDERVELMNQIDLFTIVLSGLFAAQKSEVYSVETIGLVISNMVANNAFASTTDDLTTRTNNLDALIVDFDNALKNIPENITTDAEFDEWWSEVIIANNYNDTPQNVLHNYEQNFVKVGASDAEINSISQKNAEAGPAFLYMFMSEKQINACNNTIKKRYNQEIKNWQWETKILRGAVDEQTLYNQYKAGCTIYYGMSPEKKIQQLFDFNAENGGGKVGEPVSAIIGAVVAVISLIISLVYMILDIYKISYEADDNYKEGVPDQSGDGWNLGDALAKKNAKVPETKTNKKESKGGSNTLLYVGAAALIVMLLM